MENRIVLDLVPAKDNPRNSEGSFVQLKSGRILFIYTHYYSGQHDFDSAYLASRYSDDDGATWSQKDEIVLEKEGKWNTMSVSLLRLKSGRIGMFYLNTNSINDCICRVRISEDEARTWSEPVDVTAPVDYYVVNNDRVIQIKSGRLVVPCALHTGSTDSKFNESGIIFYLLSDDEGKTWRYSKTRHEAEKLANPVNHVYKEGEYVESREGVFQEPGIVELNDGRIYSFIRTDMGEQYHSWSSDDGETWSKPEPSGLLSSCSPASIKRIPSTGDLLLIWNDHSKRYGLAEPTPDSWDRTPFVCAVSRDEGKTWEKYKLLESDNTSGFCYASIFFVKDKALISYQAGGKNTGFVLNRNAMRRVDLEWIYG